MGVGVGGMDVGIAVGAGVGVGAGVAVGAGVGEGIGAIVGDGAGVVVDMGVEVGAAVEVSVGGGMGVAVGAGAGVGVGVGVYVAALVGEGDVVGVGGTILLVCRVVGAGWVGAGDARSGVAGEGVAVTTTVAIWVVSLPQADKVATKIVSIASTEMILGIAPLVAPAPNQFAPMTKYNPLRRVDTQTTPLYGTAPGATRSTGERRN